jgi:hypothetical protein
MSKPTEDTVLKLQFFLDTLPKEVTRECSLCSKALTHIVKKAEVETGAGTATVTKALAEKINEGAAPGDKVTGEKLRDRVRYAGGETKMGNSPDKPEKAKKLEIWTCANCGKDSPTTEGFCNSCAAPMPIEKPQKRGDSKTLFDLKRLWVRATKKDRIIFHEWTMSN